MKPSVTIVRNTDNGRETMGTLSAVIEGNPQVFSCDVLERPWLNNQSDVSCIPAGVYDAIWSFQGDLNEWHYELQNTGIRKGIFMHEGDFYYNSQGCLLLGVHPSDINADGQIDVTSSKPTVADFEAFCGRVPITVTIVAVQK
jgi:hypothetical protein